MVHKTENVFAGHIIHCRDVDSGMEMNIEVLINVKIDEELFQGAYERACMRNEVVNMTSDNTWEFEYLQPSGTMVKTIKLREELQPMTVDSVELLKQMTHG